MDANAAPARTGNSRVTPVNLAGAAVAALCLAAYDSGTSEGRVPISAP